MIHITLHMTIHIFVLFYNKNMELDLQDLEQLYRIVSSIANEKSKSKRDKLQNGD